MKMNLGVLQLVLPKMQKTMSRRRRGRDISGVLVVDKPQRWSSNDAVQRAKRLFNARKVGHTGALDPLATGVLPLCFGEATKFSQFLLSSDKKYWVRAKLGVATDSGDADGKVVATNDIVNVDVARIESALRFFRGEIDQVPSMFSAIKHQGQPLYKLARQGIEIERQARRVTIYSNELVGFEDDQLELEIHCSKGTYIRSLVEELGQVLDCGAHVIALRRRMAGPFDESDLVTFDLLETALAKNGTLDGLLQPVSSAVRGWPEVRLTDNTAYYLKQGQAVTVPHAPASGWVRLAEIVDDDSTRFIGVGEVLDDGRVAPRRLIVRPMS